VNYLKSLASRRRDEEQGFTLIELMVVVLIIAILIAIAIPTFLGARARAQDRAAQSDLRNALTAEKTVYTDAQTYDGSGANMAKVEPSLGWVGQVGPPVVPAKLTLSVGDVIAGDKGLVCISEASKSGTTFSIADISTGASAGTYFGKGTAAAATCPATPTVATMSVIGSGW
jgi:type IV pilus assembly protein PilA